MDVTIDKYLPSSQFRHKDMKKKSRWCYNKHKIIFKPIYIHMSNSLYSFYSTQFMSNCFSSVSQFCGSWETVGLDGVLISLSTSGDATSSSTFLSLARLSCLLRCRLTLRDRRRETWRSPPHFSNARAISKRPVGKFHHVLTSNWEWDEVTAISCDVTTFIHLSLLDLKVSKPMVCCCKQQNQNWGEYLNQPARSNDLLLGINEGSIPQLLWNLLICMKM